MKEIKRNLWPKKKYPNKSNEHKMYTNNYDIIQTCDQAIKCTQISQTSIH